MGEKERAENGAGPSSEKIEALQERRRSLSSPAFSVNQLLMDSTITAGRACMGPGTPRH